MDAPNPATRPYRIDVRTAAFITIAILSALALFAIVRNARTALTQVLVGVIIALALDPLVVATRRRTGVPRGLAVAIVGFGFLAIGGLAVGLLGPPAREQADRFRKELPETIREFEDLPVVGSKIKQYDIETKATAWVDELPDKLNEETISNAASRLLSNVAGLVIVACSAIAVLLDGERLVSRFRRLFRYHPERLERVDRVGRVLYSTLGQYFGGSLTVALLMGTFVLIVGLALSIPLAPLAALWAMFTDLIPQVGGFLGGSFLVVLALAKGPVVAIIAGVLFVIYMNIENHIISPAIVGQSVHLSPPTTMLAAFVGGAVAGLPGALVATPLIGATKRLYLEYRFGQVADTKRTPFLGRLRNLIQRRKKPSTVAVSTHDA